MAGGVELFRMDLKRQLRLKFRNWMKENVSKEFSFFNGEIIKEKIAATISQTFNPTVSIFISKHPEISTAPLLDHLYAIGAKVYIPAWNSGEMWMCHVESGLELQKLLDETPVGKIPMPTTNIVPITVRANKIMKSRLLFRMWFMILL